MPPFGGSQTGIALSFVAFARDAISFTHWNTGTSGGALVNDLTVAQLRDIFITCAITDWSQVPSGTSGPINMFTAIAGSGNRVAWETFLGGGNSSTCIPAPLKDGNVANGERVLQPDQMFPIEQALNDPGAADEGLSISFMSVGKHLIDPVLRSNSLIGNIGGVVPSEANIVSGPFPFSRNVYNVYPTPAPPPPGAQPVASGAVRRFLGMVSNVTPDNAQLVGWICKGDAYHSEPIGTPGPGSEDALATRDWAETKKPQFARNGLFQLTVSYANPADPPNPIVHRCELPIVVVNS